MSAEKFVDTDLRAAERETRERMCAAMCDWIQATRLLVELNQEPANALLLAEQVERALNNVRDWSRR